MARRGFGHEWGKGAMTLGRGNCLSEGGSPEPPKPEESQKKIGASEMRPPIGS